MGAKVECTHLRAAHKHGTRNAYMEDDCRCAPCTLANYRARAAGRGYADAGTNVPRCGVRRRLEALHTLGWSAPQVAARIGISRDALNGLRESPSPVVYAATAARIAAIYDELWDQQPRTGYVDRTRRWAQRSGFVPPMLWDDDTIDDPNARPAANGRDDNDPHLVDEIAVEEAMAGNRVPLTRRERRAAIDRLTERGMGTREIGERVRITPRGVTRQRARVRRRTTTEAAA